MKKLPRSSSRVIGLGALSGCEIRAGHGGDTREEGHECHSPGCCLSSACKSQEGPLGTKELLLIRAGNKAGPTAARVLAPVSASIGINKQGWAERGRAPSANLLLVSRGSLVKAALLRAAHYHFCRAGVFLQRPEKPCSLSPEIAHQIFKADYTQSHTGGGGREKKNPLNCSLL